MGIFIAAIEVRIVFVALFLCSALLQSGSPEFARVPSLQLSVTSLKSSQGGTSDHFHFRGCDHGEKMSDHGDASGSKSESYFEEAFEGYCSSICFMAMYLGLANLPFEFEMLDLEFGYLVGIDGRVLTGITIMPGLPPPRV